MPVEKITWVASVDEDLTEYRPPRRFTVELIPGRTGQADLLAEGKIDTATLPGSGGSGSALAGARPLFGDPYPEI